MIPAFSNKKILLIANPFAGHGHLKKKWDSKIFPALKDVFPPFEVVFTKQPREATQLAKKGCLENFDFIFALGGDGTLNEVINGFFDKNDNPIDPHCTLGILPFGSGGDFLRGLNYPRNFYKALIKLQNAQIHKIDIGKITYENSRFVTRYFLNIANAGVVANIMNRVNSIPRFLFPLWRYLLGTCLGFCSYNNQNVELTIDDTQKLSFNLTNLLVANGNFFGRGMQPTPQAKINDGLFDVLILKNANLFKFSRYLPRLYRGSIPAESDHHLTLRCQKISLKKLEQTLPLSIEMDGEPYGEGNVSFLNLKENLSIFY